VKKAVVGGRVRQPQVVIQGMPPVSQTAIPAGYPYLNVTSDVDYTKPFKTKERVKSMSTQTETQAQPEVKEERVRASGKGRGPEIRVEPVIGFMPGMLASGKGRGPEIGEGVSELKGDSLFLSLPTKTPSQQLSLLKSKISAGTTKQFPVLRATTGTQAGPSLTTTEVQTDAPIRMTTEAQTNLIEHVGAKETKEMGTETEPVLVNIKQGMKRDVFSLVEEQQATGGIFSLTTAGRPKREFRESVALATPPPSPAPPPAAPAPAPAAPAVPVGSASSSSSVPGYTVITRPSAGIVTDKKTGLKYSYSYPGGKVKQMPPVAEVIDLS
jgi:hypothetical protein